MALNVEVLGEGEPLVVRPSFSLDHRAMARAVEPAFSAADGWRRLYVDLPGTGSSPAGEPHSDAVLDEVVATVEEHVGGRGFAVAGWSYGGYLAAGLSRRLPGQVRGLMMVCAGLRIRPADRDLTGVLDSTPEADWLSGVPVHLHEYLRHAVGRQTFDVGHRVAAVLEGNGSTDEAYLAALRSEGFALSDENAPTDLDAPACLVAGRRDRVAGYVDLFRALGRLSQADYACIASAGHYLPVEYPYPFAVVARAWLRRCHPDSNGEASR